MTNPVPRMSRLLLGLAVGVEATYRAIRTAEALRDLRAPAAPFERPEPARYGATRRALALAGIARGIAGLGVFAFVHAPRLDRALAPLPRAARAAAFGASLALYDAALDWGVDYVEGHVLERRFGLSERSGTGWAADRLKATAIGAAVAALLAVPADAIVRRAPRRWPWIAIAATPGLLTLATVIAPTFVMPLFNRYEPLSGELERRIRDLAARYGAGDAAILRFDMSKQTRKANAFVTGVFGTKRIALGDTLIDNFAEDETLFVVAHELGHYVRRDPWAAIALGTITLGATILVAERGARAATGRPLETVADAARAAFYGQLAALVLGPLTNAASRAIERRADRFAIAATNDPGAGARAFRRLRDQNLAEDEAPVWWEALFASHPPIRRRIAALEAAAGS